MYSIALSWEGPLDNDELSEFCRVNNLRIRTFSLKEALYERDPARIDEALTADLALFRFSGTSPFSALNAARNLVGKRRWKNRKAIVAARTQDSHVLTASEKRADFLVDQWFLSHERYMDHLPEAKVFHVPCGVEGLSRQEAISVAQSEILERTPGVISPFRIYRNASRNHFAYAISKALSSMEITHHFGETLPDGKANLSWSNLSHLARFEAVLNLPLGFDVNMRYLEATLAGTPTVGLRSSPQVPPAVSESLFLSGNTPTEVAKTIRDVIREHAHLNISRASRYTIATEHLSNDRLYEIVSKSLAFEPIRTNSITPEEDSREKQVLSNSQGEFARHRSLALIAGGPTVFSPRPRVTPYPSFKTTRAFATLIWPLHAFFARKRMLGRV